MYVHLFFPLKKHFIFGGFFFSKISLNLREKMTKNFTTAQNFLHPKIKGCSKLTLKLSNNLNNTQQNKVKEKEMR
jgi:hypothetical protein